MALFGRKKNKTSDQPDGTTPLERLAGQGPDDRAGHDASDPRARGAEHDEVGRDAAYRDDRDQPVASRPHEEPTAVRRDDGAAAGREGAGVGTGRETRHDKGEHRGPGRGTAAAGGAVGGAAATRGHDDRAASRHDEQGRQGSERGTDVGRRDHDREPLRDLRERQKEEYGGFSIASAFFGYLVAVGISVLVVAILGAAGAAIGFATVGSAGAAEQSAATIGIVGGVLLLVALAIAYYVGGYVAGRLARFDGAKQGVGVWIISILVVVVAGVVGAVAGSQYNVLNSLQLPSIPVSGSSLTTGGIIALVAAILVTLLAAILGGKLGQRWHKKVDRVGR